MPTGYTADIIDGKIRNAKQFAQKCARAFMWNMRDVGWDAPLKRPEHSSTRYESEWLANSKVALAKWNAMDHDDKYDMWRDYADKTERSGADAKYEAETNLKRLMRVRNSVEAITVPETHAEFKNFMLSQIDDTIRFDGTYNEEYYRVLPFEEWVASQDKHVVESVERATKRLAEMRDKEQQGVEWLTTLVDLYDLDIED